MSDENKSYFSVRLADSLILALDKIVTKRNAAEGVKTWSRNKLIEKAIRDYYSREIADALNEEKGVKKEKRAG